MWIVMDMTLSKHVYSKKSHTHLDWLTVVIKYRSYQGLTNKDDLLDDLKQFLSRYFGLNFDSLDIFNMKHGIYKFDYAFSFFDGGAIVGYNETKFMLQFSGRGLESLEDYYGIDRFINYLRLCTLNGIEWTCSRWDLARDLYNWPRTYSPDTVYHERRRGNLVGRVMYYKPVPDSGSVVRPSELRGYERELLLGSTLYLGKNPFQLRIYNKLAERYRKTKVAFDFKRWTRWELQMNSNKADYYFQKWIASGNSLEETWKLIIKANFRFVVNHSASIDKSRNRSKLKTAKWWSRLIDTNDNWDKAPSVIRVNTASSRHRYYKSNVGPHAALRLNTLVRGYLKNGVSVEDARELGKTAFLHELDEMLPDNAVWVNNNRALFSGSAWNDLDSNLTMINTETGQIYDFDTSV